MNNIQSNDLNLQSFQISKNCKKLTKKGKQIHYMLFGFELYFTTSEEKRKAPSKILKIFDLYCSLKAFSNHHRVIMILLKNKLILGPR